MRLPCDHEKHPVSFHFGIRSKLYKLINTIKVDLDGFADVSGYIDTYTDDEEESVNGLFVPGNMFTVHGFKIRIEGEDPSCGLYFVPVDDPSKAVKVDRIAKNNPSELTGIAPDTGYQYNRLEIRTQFSSSGNPPMKAVRTITSMFVLESG